MLTIAADAISSVSAAAKPRQETRVINQIPVGKMVRQGDLYLIRVNPKKSISLFKDTVTVNLSEYANAPATNKQFYQLVPGSTKGSRHQIAQAENISFMINPTNQSTLVGPMIVAKENFTVVHPEHAHIQLPAGEYLVCYQLNDKTKQRVKD